MLITLIKLLKFVLSYDSDSLIHSQSDRMNKCAMCQTKLDLHNLEYLGLL